MYTFVSRLKQQYNAKHASLATPLKLVLRWLKWKKRKGEKLDPKYTFITANLSNEFYSLQFVANSSDGIKLVKSLPACVDIPSDFSKAVKTMLSDQLGKKPITLACTCEHFTTSLLWHTRKNIKSYNYMYIRMG